MIFLLIAGTYTPVGLLVLEGTLATVVWPSSGAGRWPGSILEPRLDPGPGGLGGTVYLALGWVAVVATPRCSPGSGWPAGC